EVELRFSKQVARRVLESRWHPSEKITEQKDGSLMWCASIAEPQEMLPWIRGWGADVEVLKPEQLRETLKNEVEKMAGLYGIP
ncbi:MAG: WYL domain-containing protein, partial [Chloroflexi bacterium]|nr:WYL domain-containing protein [Chloroflexota bacterium]